MVKHFVIKNNLILISLLVMIPLGVFSGEPVSRYAALVDWNTIITLSGLLLTTTAMRESGAFSHLARNILVTIRNERTLAFALVLTAVLLSMFLTNDIALFIVVPLTLSLQELTGNNFLRLIIFEALGVNVGSTLTPIGNPQNIFLWHQWGISFPRFVWEMFPVFGLLMVLLLLLVGFSFPARKVAARRGEETGVNWRLFACSLILFVIFLLSIEAHLSGYFLGLLGLSYLVFYRRIFRVTDWGLILLFMIIFVDLHLLSELSPIQRLFSGFNLQNPLVLFSSGILTSQIISNVPAAILLSKFSADWATIALAVNVGGNGLIIASFANLIALRMVTAPGKVRYFHRYSLPFLVLSFLLTALLLL